jgi:hypothetical protein
MPCVRHEHCAYSGSEEGRCPRCHATWESIAAPHSAASPGTGGGTRQQHESWHDKRDAAASKSRASLREARAKANAA